jgi:hypothetical protein
MPPGRFGCRNSRWEKTTHTRGAYKSRDTTEAFLTPGREAFYVSLFLYAGQAAVTSKRS